MYSGFFIAAMSRDVRRERITAKSLSYRSCHVRRAVHLSLSIRKDSYPVLAVNRHHVSMAGKDHAAGASGPTAANRVRLVVLFVTGAPATCAELAKVVLDPVDQGQVGIADTVGKATSLASISTEFSELI